MERGTTTFERLCLRKIIETSYDHIHPCGHLDQRRGIRNPINRPAHCAKYREQSNEYFNQAVS